MSPLEQEVRQAASGVEVVRHDHAKDHRGVQRAAADGPGPEARIGQGIGPGLVRLSIL